MPQINSEHRWTLISVGTYSLQIFDATWDSIEAVREDIQAVSVGRSGKFHDLTSLYDWLRNNKNRPILIVEAKERVSLAAPEQRAAFVTEPLALPPPPNPEPVESTPESRGWRPTSRLGYRLEATVEYSQDPIYSNEYFENSGIYIQRDGGLRATVYVTHTAVADDHDEGRFYNMDVEGFNFTIVLNWK